MLHKEYKFLINNFTFVKTYILGMKKKLLYTFYLCLIIFFFSCATNQKIQVMKPESDEAAPIKYPINSSYISFPTTLTVKSIENQTNKLLQGLIYEDTNIEDDKSEMKIWKSGTIQIIEENKKLKTILPLKIWAKVKYGTSALGVNLYDTREFNLKGTITLLSDVKMSNWKINTVTVLEDFVWDESPTITIAGKNIAITYLLNPTIKIFGYKIEKSIDSAMDKALDFKSNMLDLMDKTSVPLELSPTYQTWLKITPQELYATDAKLLNGAVKLTVGLKCLMESSIGQQPKTNFKKENLLLKSFSNIPDKVSANITAVSKYQDASRVITNNFKGKEFSSGSRKIIINNVEIWHKKGKMIIALDLLGSLNGRIYLSGFPEYNKETKEIFFEDLDYVLETKNTLIKTANWFAQGIILKKIRENCRYSIAPNLEEGKQNILKYLKNYSPSPGIFVNGQLKDIVFQKVVLTNESIVAFLNITGNVKIDINGL
jgi:hypothetical protein